MCDSNLTTNLAGRLAEAVEEAARRDRAEAVPLGFTTPLALGFEKFERALRAAPLAAAKALVECVRSFADAGYFLEDLDGSPSARPVEVA